MGRPLRDDAPGYHHVWTRCVDGVVVFPSDYDRLLFLSVLGTVVRRYSWDCLAYCLMSNHYHVVLRTPDRSLPRGIHYLNGVFAREFNAAYDRRGHVFGSRYGSRPIASDKHLLDSIRYVDLNPVRAGVCAHPAAWEWSSYRALAGLEQPPRLLAAAEVWRIFDADDDVAQAEYARFVALELVAA
jgi:putative transposase